MFGLTLQQMLGLTVLAAMVTAAGSLIATVLKEFFFTRSLEKWKERQTLKSIHRKYSGPVMEAAKDLEVRLSEIWKSHPPPDYLRSAVLSDTTPPVASTNSQDDPHYKRHRLLSTAYRLSAFLGWLELYRQDSTFLDTGQKNQNVLFDEPIEGFRDALAQGRLNPKWAETQDLLIFRDEQRAIGEAMIRDYPNGRAVIGYGAYSELYGRASNEVSLSCLLVACNFFIDLKEAGDFRQERAKIMDQKLCSIIKILADDRRQAAAPRMEWIRKAARRIGQRTISAHAADSM